MSGAVDNVPRRQNRYNRGAGDKWRNQCIDWLRDFGWKGAGPVLEKMRGDILGIGDVTIECTLAGWDDIWEKIRQDARDAANNGHDLWGVWKKHNRVNDPGQGGVLVRGDVFWRAAWRLEKLEAADLRADDAFAQGFTAGVTYALKHPNLDPSEEAVR